MQADTAMPIQQFLAADSMTVVHHPLYSAYWDTWGILLSTHSGLYWICPDIVTC